jgi:hypothetical protein
LNYHLTDKQQSAIVAWGGDQVAEPHIFRTYNHPEPADPLEKKTHFNYGSPSQEKIWKVARATSAAPRYFSKQTIGESTYLDGGMAYNNPAYYIYEELEALHGDKGPEFIISIGTGTSENAKKPSHWYNPFHHSRDMFQTISKVLPDIVTDSKKQHEHLERSINRIQRERKKHDSSDIHPRYFRFNVPSLGSEIALDEWKADRKKSRPNGDKTLRKIENATTTYLANEDIKRALQDCAIELVELRRRRAETEHWEEFATHCFYACPSHDNCGAARFPNREEMRKHALEEHHCIERTPSREVRPCTRDECRVAVSPFEYQGDDAHIEHLRTSHRIATPVLMSPGELHAWVDARRRNSNDRAPQV